MNYQNPAMTLDFDFDREQSYQSTGYIGVPPPMAEYMLVLVGLIVVFMKCTFVHYETEIVHFP